MGEVEQSLIYVGFLGCCLSVCRWNSLRYLGSRSHQDSRSGSLFSSPLMCCILIWHFHLACRNTSFLRKACRNGSLALPFCMTTTELKLSQSMTTPLPARDLPDTFRATIRVNISRTFMCIPRAWILWGNVAWKNFPRHQPPAPVRQASHAMMLSGSDQNLSGIMDTPL